MPVHAAAILTNWQPLAAAVPSCSLGANTTAPTVGTSLVLTAACAGSPVVFEWLACSPLTPDACSVVPQCATASTTCSPVNTQQGAVLYALRASKVGDVVKVTVLRDGKEVSVDVKLAARK